ncbi:DUF3679 domain-containing protein [Niallia sp. Krafla_26]|uniref:DUF3679 domain-containing protein n=1 Tax=Niallia sp. Krafla_26 TaxID=3064703 RepID=UPI003D1645C6
MLKSMFLAILMFVSVLFGMQQANEGIVKMKGYGHEQFQGVFMINNSSEGELEASILGNDLSSHDIEKKKAELEEMKAFNFFSSIGKAIAQFISSMTDLIIQFIAGLLTK